MARQQQQQQHSTVVLITMFLCLISICYGFTPIKTYKVERAGRSIVPIMSPVIVASTTPKKGFGNEKEMDKEVKKPKSIGAQQREEGSKKYDDIATAGGQEYRIFVRQFGSNDQSWLPCGLIAVPRNGQVSSAIYSNTVELEKAIVRTYPKLKGYEMEFEYGYNLKIYPDDPIEVAKKTGTADSNNMFSFGGWMKNLLSPIDTSSMKPPSV